MLSVDDLLSNLSETGRMAMADGVGAVVSIHSSGSVAIAAAPPPPHTRSEARRRCGGGAAVARRRCGAAPAVCCCGTGKAARCRIGVAGLVLREDAVTEENRREALQRPAPEVEDGYFLVPRVIE